MHPKEFNIDREADNLVRVARKMERLAHSLKVKGKTSLQNEAQDAANQLITASRKMFALHAKIQQET